MSQFNAVVDVAKLQGQEWVETTADIIKHFQPHGMGGQEYFCYKGIKICEGIPGKPGEKSAALEEKLEMQMGALVHGEGEGVLLGV